MNSDVISTQSPIDGELARQWTVESRSSTLMNLAFGGAALILALGAGTAATVWAANTGTDPEAIKAALADLPPVRVEGTVKAEGSVSLEPGATVRLEEGATVRLADGSVVELKPGAKVQVEGGGRGVGPQVQLPQTKEDPAIQTEVIVFQQVPHGDGEVHTGWRYKSGNAKAPHGQFCYYTKQTMGGAHTRADIYADDKIVQTPGVSNEEQSTRFSKCQFHPSLPNPRTSPYTRPFPSAGGVI